MKYLHFMLHIYAFVQQQLSMEQEQCILLK